MKSKKVSDKGRKVSDKGRKGINTIDTDMSRGDKMSTAWPYPTPQGEGPGAGPGSPC